MTYDSVASVCQVISLLLFMGLFLAVLVYALKPSNGPRFERARRAALKLDHARPEDIAS